MEQNLRLVGLAVFKLSSLAFANPQFVILLKSTCSYNLQNWGCPEVISVETIHAGKVFEGSQVRIRG
jgi:hypothetical protein